MIGGIRLVQKRREEGTSGLCYPSIFDTISDHCLVQDEFSGRYACRARSCCNGTQALSPHRCFPNDSYVDISSCLSWSVVDDREGYIFDFNLTLPLEQAKQVISTMEKIRWIDSDTKSLQILSTAYSPNLKRFMSVSFNIDISEVGFYEPTAEIIVLDLDPFAKNGPYYESRMGVDVMWLLFATVLMIFNLYKVLSIMSLPGTKLVNLYHYHDFGFWVGPAVSITDFIVLGKFMAIYNHADRSALIEALRSYRLTGDDSSRFTNPAFTSFVDLSTLGSLEMDLNSTLAVLLLLQILLALHTFRVSLRAEQLVSSLGRAIPDIVGFVPLYLFILTAYALAGHILYGSRVASFQTISYSFFAVFELNFGLLDIQPLYEDGSAGSLIYVTTSLIVFTMILLNIILSIIMRAWECAHWEIEHRKTLAQIGFVPCHVTSVFRDMLQSTYDIRKFALNLRSDSKDNHWIAEKNQITRAALKMKIFQSDLKSDLKRRMNVWFSLSEKGSQLKSKSIGKYEHDGLGQELADQRLNLRNESNANSKSIHSPVMQTLNMPDNQKLDLKKESEVGIPSPVVSVRAAKSEATGRVEMVRRHR
ncbi:hypothetical protein AAMO2058_001254500 [Amorphochlora amoebiformis]